MVTKREAGAADGRAITEGRYGESMGFDRWGWGSHCVDCYPSNCPYRVYVKDGVIVREEQAGTFPVIEPGVPDMNPMGCQKGRLVEPPAVRRRTHPASDAARGRAR